MMVADWGVDEESVYVRSSSGPPRAAHEIREVQEQAVEGFELLDDSFMSSYAPAIWPREHRRWAQDHSTHFKTVVINDEPASRYPWTVWDHIEIERDYNELLVAAGLPPRPAGRLWLLRPPARLPDLNAALSELTRRAVAAGAEPMLCAGLVEVAARVVGEWVVDGWM